ncbi:MAG: ABC transporter ATP-binding protein, partial [Spirochaetales bacterium]|nr:ABC transporter ATP-binding protein [Spirochaetales bacterium]
LALVRHIVKSHNMAAVLTLHDLNAALRYADRVLFLSNGQIAAEKQVTEVTTEIISQVYDMDVDMLMHQGLPLVVPRDRAA